MTYTAYESFNKGVTYSLEAQEARAAGRHEEAKRLDQSALAFFDDTLKANPEHLLAMSGMALTLASLGSTEKAVDMFRRALQLEPSNYENIRQLGLCLLELGEIAEARDATLRAVSIGEDTEYTHNAAVEVYNFAGQIMMTAAQHRDSGHRREELTAYGLAEQVFSLAIELDPSWVPPKDALRLIYSLIGKGEA